MSNVRWRLVAALASLIVLALGASPGGAARFRPQANVVIRLAATPRPAAVGSNLTYMLTVRNLGPHRAGHVVVRDRLPAQVAFVSASSSQGTCSGSAIVDCSLGALARGAMASVTIVVQPTQNGQIVNRASVQASQPDRANWNNHATLALNVGQVANLGLTLRAAPRPATVGQPLTYVLTVRNLSAIDATGVVLANHVPNRSTLVSATGSQGSCTGSGMISCTLGTISAGASAQITIVVQPTVVGYVSDRATVKGDEVDPYRANNTRATTVRVRPAT